MNESESESENHVGRLSPPLRLCLSVDPLLGGGQDGGVLASDRAGLLYRYGGGRAGYAREAGRGSKRAEAGGLEGHKERSHRVVDPAVRVNDWWRRVAGSFCGREPEYQGPHVAARERGRKTETGARGDAIIIDAAAYCWCTRRSAGCRRTGRCRWAGLGGAKGGGGWAADVTHAQLTAWIPTGGRRYMQILVGPGPKQTKGPLPARLPARPHFSEGPDRGGFPGPWRTEEGASGYLLLARCCLVKVPR